MQTSSINRVPDHLTGILKILLGIDCIEHDRFCHHGGIQGHTDAVLQQCAAGNGKLLFRNQQLYAARMIGINAAGIECDGNA